ncbi:hypothetical protein LOZ12_000476 [Ophidiomyces ophidiicola]|uniref:Uncharacterized protein n=1 Tax=Ophidiomyces ophidiicola TaxID=1387563 RepID=A0ACB8V517_9EURO|nr:hypothetical protein LOZ64_000414 [Ophidiomyces ophidiicola]KAI1955650.1 hypothetical protein LOZ62_000201 [Ophidiomyces ophidiicola]KAI1975946.1 hypothetical protein LOZ56_000263 [Ophidiomyces ophidiicola]KAI2011407.1 hypothetical protein LOZ50_000767 [Ophidiomyces ophidiicola]KAI2015276.1 hypothetical protein LOZ46_005301 [Ophidiomyces ophidiicola]
MRSSIDGAKAAEAGVNEKSHPVPQSPDNGSTAPSDEISKDAQNGVRYVEGATSVWTKGHLMAAYANIWLIYFVVSMEEVVVRSLNPYVTSAFQLHSLTAATGIMASIIGGLSKIPLAKILDTWGRPQGMALMLFFWVIGYIMKAACNNVQTYAAAQVFSSVGAQGVSYCLTVFIADTSSLKNRSLMLAYATSPYVITTWVGGPVAKSILATIGWRWGFGIFTIVVPAVVLPLCFLFLWGHRKAERLGIVQRSEGLRNLNLQKVKKYAIDVDLIGILVLAAGMALFLLPFSLWTFQGQKWKAPLIICMIIFGGLLLIFFVIYEKYIAPVTFIPFKLLTDRTVLFGALFFLFVFFNGAVWSLYFFSMLQVVWELDVTNATYISNIYRVGSCLWALVVGVLIRWTGRFKWLAVYFSVPLLMLGVGLMIHFRQPGTNIGYIVMTQIFVAFASGTNVITGEMAMMAPSDHQHIAVILAILNLFASVGQALGATVATVIWTSRFRSALEEYLPANADIAKIYASLVTQLSHKPGTPIRIGISHAYAEAQRYMLVTGVCVLCGALVCAALWRDIKLNDKKQVKGTVV